jgi:hypothetical protein
MANYNESTITSTTYQRAKFVSIVNEYNKPPFISFSEELIIPLEDGQPAHKDLGVIGETFTDNNKTENVFLIDPITGELSTSTITYDEIYNIIRSLYLHMATKRDNAQ